MSSFVLGLLIGLNVGILLFATLGAAVSVWFHFEVCHKWLKKRGKL